MISWNNFVGMLIADLYVFLMALAVVIPAVLGCYFLRWAVPKFIFRRK